MALTDKLSAIGNAIRAKTGDTGKLTLDGMVIAINGITTGDNGGTGGESSGAGSEWPTQPDDGKTRLYITLEEGRTSPMLGVCPNGTVEVDWGDGTTPDVLTGTSNSSSAVKWTPTHHYDAPGNYVITLTVTEGNAGFGGNNTTNANSFMLRYSSEADARNQVYQAAVRRIEFGAGFVSCGARAFKYCTNLESLSFENADFISISTETFGYCSALREVSLHADFTGFGVSGFTNCTALRNVKIPNKIKTIGSSTFMYCKALCNLTFPNSLNTIADTAFTYCTGMKFYDFTACTAVPTLQNVSAFRDIPADCEIRVPASLYDEWIAATNWVTYADNIKAY